MKKYFIFLMISFLVFSCVKKKMHIESEETSQNGAIFKMNECLQRKDFEEFYQKYAHSHLKKQVSLQRFVSVMASTQGEMEIDLFQEVVKALENKVDVTILKKGYQKDLLHYEFILVKIKNQKNRFQNKKLWHIELGFEDGSWKLRDTD